MGKSNAKRLQIEQTSLAGHAIKQLDPALADVRTPRYVQVASILRHRIEAGVWDIGAQLPTLDELEHEFGVARVTVRQAITLLSEEGLLASRQGKGTFVTATVRRDRWLNLGADWRSLLAPIAHNVPHLLSFGAVGTPPLQAEDGAAASGYVFIHSVQTREDAPYALAQVYVARDIFDRAPSLFRKRIALAVLSELIDIRDLHVRQDLQIATADLATARHLKIELNAPIATARVVATHRSGTVVYFAEIRYRGDCVRISIDLPFPPE